MALPKEPEASLFPEKHKIIERPTKPEITPEVEEHLEAVSGEEISLPGPVQDDTTGATIVDTPVPQQVTVTLPLTKSQASAGLATKTTDSLRWLTEWCLRLLKKMGGNFIYRLKKS